MKFLYSKYIALLLVFSFLTYANIAFTDSNHSTLGQTNNYQQNLSGKHAASLNSEQLSLVGWSANSNVALEVNTEQVKFGSASVSGKTAANGVFDRIEYRFPAQPGLSYHISLWAKREVGQTQALTQWQGVESFEVQYIDTAFWRRYEQTVVATDNEIVIRAYASIEGNAGDDVYVDGLSISSSDFIFSSVFEELVIQPPKIEDRKTDTGLINLITENPNFDGTTGWTVESAGHLFAEDSHTPDGSGSVELITHLSQLAGPTFACENNKRYVLSAYMKASHFPKGQNVRIQVHGGSSYWNASAENQWEEILVPFIPDTDNGICRIFIATDILSYSTTFVEHSSGPEYELEPEEVRPDGSNLDGTSQIFIDDIKVVRSDEILPREAIVEKRHFEGPYIRIDDLGNFTVNRGGQWTAVFPKMMYLSRHGDPNQSETENLYQRSLKYVEYGFNGLMSVFSIERDVVRPLEAGIQFVGVPGSQPFRVDGNDRIKTTIPALKSHLEAVGNKLTTIIAELDTDPITQKRQHPFFMLNGTYGSARSYLNETSELMDFTGSYSALGSSGLLVARPKETLGVIDKTHNQIAPAPLIQLQCYHHEQFVPALFFGIIQGGKALGMWRDGTEFQPPGGVPCQLNFHHVTADSRATLDGLDSQQRFG